MLPLNPQKMSSLKLQGKKARFFFFAKLNEMAFFFAFMSHGNAALLKKEQQFQDKKLSLNENRPLVLIFLSRALCSRQLLKAQRNTKK